MLDFDVLIHRQAVGLWRRMLLLIPYDRRLGFVERVLDATAVPPERWPATVAGAARMVVPPLRFEECVRLVDLLSEMLVVQTPTRALCAALREARESLQPTAPYRVAAGRQSV